jgi:hypothetical protein
MIDILKSGEGHSYVAAAGKDGQKMWQSNDEKVNGLLTLCAAKSVDQESVLIDKLRELYLSKLQM